MPVQCFIGDFIFELKIEAEQAIIIELILKESDVGEAQSLQYLLL